MEPCADQINFARPRLNSEGEIPSSGGNREFRHGADGREYTLRSSPRGVRALFWRFGDFQHARGLSLQLRVQLPCHVDTFEMSRQVPLLVID